MSRFETRSSFAVFMGVKNLKIRLLVAYRKEETGYPSTVSREKNFRGSQAEMEKNP